MKFSLASFFVLAAGALAQLQINTPTGALSAIQCTPYQVTWTGGTGPFEIRLLDAGQNFLEEIVSSTNASPFTWTPNVAAGTSVIFSIHDSVGGTSSSAPFTIQPSSNSACLSASSTPSSTAAGSSPVSSSAASTPVSSAPGSSASSVASSVASASSTPLSTASSVSRPSSASTPSTTASSTRPVSTAPSTTSAAPSQTSSSSAMTLVTGGFVGPIVAALLALAA